MEGAKLTVPKGKVKGKHTQKQKAKTQINLFYYWVGLGPMGLWLTEKDNETEFATMSSGTSAGVPFDNRPISTKVELKAGLKPEWDNMGVKNKRTCKIYPIIIL